MEESLQAHRDESITHWRSEEKQLQKREIVSK